MSEDQPQASLDILLVEDNEDDVETVRRAFARGGVNARFRVARDGQRALEVLFLTGTTSRPKGAWLPHLIFLDLKLPKAQGLEILREVKADPVLSAVPVVVLTGSARREVMVECMALGTNMCLLKPMDLGDVVNVVAGIRRYWLAGRLERKAA